MKRLESISAFFPAYNDAATIASMVIAAALTLQKLSEDFEIIVVNDGSRDHTAEILKELLQESAQREGAVGVIREFVLDSFQMGRPLSPDVNGADNDRRKD